MFRNNGFIIMFFATFLILVFSGCQSQNHAEDSACPEKAKSTMCETKQAQDQECNKELYAKPGFRVEIEDGRLWVLLPGQEKTEKNITLIGAGPEGMTIKANDRNTALKYLASKPGFQIDIDEDQKIWVFSENEPMERSEKHITRIGSGPLRTTLKATSRETLDAYMAAN